MKDRQVFRRKFDKFGLVQYETSEEEVVRLIENLSDGKAINENDIPTKIIKLAKFILAPILTRIFNKCINEGFYPDCLKVAEVIPIFKSREQKICSNYRPISISLQLNKIFERILYDRVYFYLQEYKLLSKYQFGFRPRSSTSYAVESIYSNLLSNADNGLYSCSIFLDLSKAFVTVNHDILFHKFYHNFGIRGIPLQLFRSYLDNRKQFVKLENVQIWFS